MTVPQTDLVVAHEAWMPAPVVAPSSFQSQCTQCCGWCREGTAQPNVHRRCCQTQGVTRSHVAVLCLHCQWLQWLLDRSLGLLETTSGVWCASTSHGHRCDGRSSPRVGTSPLPEVNSWMAPVARSAPGALARRKQALKRAIACKLTFSSKHHSPPVGSASAASESCLVRERSSERVMSGPRAQRASHVGSASSAGESLLATQSSRASAASKFMMVCMHGVPCWC